MPKELIHFTIAERTAARLADTRFGPCLKREQSGLLLGAALHDALFFAVLPGAKPLEKLAHRLHGAQGQDTFDLIRIQAAHAAKSRATPLPVALLVGLVSHLFADVAMHPLVYYFTGDYYSDAPMVRSRTRQRHRALESLMDMVACPDKIGRPSYLLSHLLRSCPDMTTTGLPMSRLADMAAFTTEDATRQLKRAWRLFALFQSAFPRKRTARLLFSLRRQVPAYVAELGMLFYAPQLLEQASTLRSTINFRHPVTGEAIRTSLDDLMDQAADSATALCRRLEGYIFNQKPLSLTEKGPSMDAGLSGMGTHAMLHFADSPFPRID